MAGSSGISRRKECRSDPTAPARGAAHRAWRTGRRRHPSHPGISAMSTNTITAAPSSAAGLRAGAHRRRADLLAARLELGATALAALARTLTDEEWVRRIPGDGRRIGVVV